MENFEQLNRMLKQALSISDKPTQQLNQNIIIKIEENKKMEHKFSKKLTGVLIAAALVVTMTISAFAAWQLLNPKQVAQQLGDNKLASAFDNKDAIKINKTVTSKGYNITLHGIISGKGLSEFEVTGDKINPERTYAVVSIAKTDGSKMPDTMDENYGNPPFLVSPLIKGQKPWRVNIFTMNGGCVEDVIDGVMYRIIDCDSIGMFADRGIYLSVINGAFINNKTFNYNEKTGEISPKADYEGVNVLFDLPLDKKKADHEKAEKYLKELFPEPIKESGDNSKANDKLNKNNTYIDLGKGLTIDLEKEVAKGTIIPESVKEVKIDKDGMANYEFESSTTGKSKTGINIKELFKNGETGVKTVSVSGGDKGDYIAIQFIRDADGKITGRTIKLNIKR